MNCCIQTQEGCIAVAPSQVCVRMLRGTTNTFEFILTDGAGEPVDISPDEVRLTVRDYYDGEIKIQKWNLPGTHLDGPNGRTEFTFSIEDTLEGSPIDITFWLYEVRRIRPGGNEHVHLQGQFLIDPAVGGEVPT